MTTFHSFTKKGENLPPNLPPNSGQEKEEALSVDWSSLSGMKIRVFSEEENLNPEYKEKIVDDKYLIIQDE